MIFREKHSEFQVLSHKFVLKLKLDYFYIEGIRFAKTVSETIRHKSQIFELCHVKITLQCILPAVYSLIASTVKFNILIWESVSTDLPLKPVSSGH